MRRRSIPLGGRVGRARDGMPSRGRDDSADRADDLPDGPLLRRPGGLEGPRRRRRLRRQDPRDARPRAQLERDPSGTDAALYGVRFVDEDHGWVVGQDGLILHTADGGKTWKKQESNATFEESDGTTKRAYLFTIDALDAEHAWAVGDRSILISTTDGGQTWRSRKVAMEGDLSGGQSLAAADPDPLRRQVRRRAERLDRRRVRQDPAHARRRRDLEGAGPSRSSKAPSSSTCSTCRRSSASTPRTGERGGGRARGAHRAHARRRHQVGLRQDRRRRREARRPAVRRGRVRRTAPAGPSGRRARWCRRSPAPTSWKRADIGQDVLTWLRGIELLRSRSTAGWSAASGSSSTPTDGGKTWLPCRAEPRGAIA